jgi:hypothetical protein
MSVIGRLDEQVEAVLITPLGKDGRTEAAPREDESAVEQATSAPRVERATAEDESFQDERASKDDLPVWLL